MLEKIEFLFDEFRKKHNNSPDYFLISYNDHMKLMQESMMRPTQTPVLNGATIVVSHSIEDDEFCFVTK